MNIIATQYDVSHNALEIYVSGCTGNPHCEGCFSPETWDFNRGVFFLDFYYQEIEPNLNNFDNLIDNIMIFGGEPLDQNWDDLKMLLEKLSKYKKDIWIFTHYSLEIALTKLKELTKYLTYIKCGAYIPTLITENNLQYGIKLATSNQKIYKKINNVFLDNIKSL